MGYTSGAMSTFSGLNASASALQSVLVRQDITSNNVANALTAGFKRSRALNAERAGGGTDIAEISRDYSQGPMEVATNAFDLGIQGEGFFKVQTPNGVGYVRAGLFGLDKNRELVTPQGFKLSPSVQIPADATGFAVGKDGRVMAFRPGGVQEEVGQITLSRFPSPGGLLQAGGGVLAPFPSAGIPRDGIPGTPGFGELGTGMLESSNVDLGQEMVDGIVNLRAFQVNARMIRAQDQMLGTLLDIRR